MYTTERPNLFAGFQGDVMPHFSIEKRFLEPHPYLDHGVLEDGTRLALGFDVELRIWARFMSWPR